MIRELINEKRASAGLNAVPTGRAGKGGAPRMNADPEWAGLKPDGERGPFYIFEMGPGRKKMVLKEKVDAFHKSRAR